MSRKLEGATSNRAISHCVYALGLMYLFSFILPWLKWAQLFLSWFFDLGWISCCLVRLCSYAVITVTPGVQAIGPSLPMVTGDFHSWPVEIGFPNKISLIDARIHVEHLIEVVHDGVSYQTLHVKAWPWVLPAASVSILTWNRPRRLPSYIQVWEVTSNRLFASHKHYYAVLLAPSAPHLVQSFFI